MSKALTDLGYVVGKEREPKPLFWAWVDSDYSKTIKFCEKAEAFQDSPFSFPNTYKYLDQAYPGNEFILTVRDDDIQ